MPSVVFGRRTKAFIDKHGTYYEFREKIHEAFIMGEITHDEKHEALISYMDDYISAKMADKKDEDDD